MWGQLAISSSLRSGSFTRWRRAWNISTRSCTLSIAIWNITTFLWGFKTLIPWTKRKGSPRSKSPISRLHWSYHKTQTILRRRLSIRFLPRMVAWPSTHRNNWKITNSWPSRSMCGLLVLLSSFIGTIIYLKPIKIKTQPAKNSNKLLKKLTSTPWSKTK